MTFFFVLLPSLLRRCGRHVVCSAITAAVLAAVSMPLHAGPGHDHDAGTETSPATARVSGHSDLFEIVGVVERGGLTIHLDRYATNEPVAQARIEVEAAAARGLAKAQADGSFRFEHDALAGLLERAGTVPVSFTITAGADTDLLAGDLVIDDPHAGDAAATATARPWRDARLLSGLAAALATVTLAITVAVLRRKRRSALH